MTFSRFVRSAVLTRVRFVRPLWYLPYSKEDAKRTLTTKYGWLDYGGHHLENRMTAFYHSVYLPQKFGVDLRVNSLAARARNGSLSREEAWALLEARRSPSDDLAHYFRARLELSEDEYERVMSQPGKSWRDFPTYKSRFERTRWGFYLLARAELVPMSFYVKYCLPEGRLTRS